MNRSTRRGLLAALLVATAMPALAQFSESTNFLKAVRERDSAKMTEIVSNASSTAINTRDRGSGEGALHILVRGRDLGWLNYLLSRGARPDLADNHGNTALAIAAQLGWVEGAEALLARRASVNAANGRGETPLIMAVHRRDAAMVRLLMSQGANPNWTDSAAGLSALDYARRDTRAGQILRLLQAPRPARPVAGPTRP
ncbi:MAG TPA: ankyrin repeat domain-containing protein [Allosphingosinicella sp.]|nr:ankyrin repeat domain-containing protein [Allosphingosinicella sp.]